MRIDIQLKAHTGQREDDLKLCTHSEALKFTACSQPATHRLRRHNAKTKAPWRYLCAKQKVEE